MTAEQSVVACAIHAWKQNVERADKFFSGLSDHQLQTEVAPEKNRLIYLWGHLIAVQASSVRQRSTVGAISSNWRKRDSSWSTDAQRFSDLDFETVLLRRG